MPFYRALFSSGNWVISEFHHYFGSIKQQRFGICLESIFSLFTFMLQRISNHILPKCKWNWHLAKWNEPNENVFPEVRVNCNFLNKSNSKSHHLNFKKSFFKQPKSARASTLSKKVKDTVVKHMRIDWLGCKVNLMLKKTASRNAMRIQSDPPVKH